MNASMSKQDVEIMRRRGDNSSADFSFMAKHMLVFIWLLGEYIIIGYFANANICEYIIIGYFANANICEYIIIGYFANILLFCLQAKTYQSFQLCSRTYFARM